MLHPQKADATNKNMKKMKYKVIDENITLESFESVREFTKICTTRKPNKAFFGYNLASERHGRASFYGTSSFDAANKIMAKGYKEGCKNLMQCKEGIQINNDAPKSKIFKSYAGFAPCVPAVLMGMPKTMYYRKKVITKMPVVNLYYDCGVNCGVSTDTMTLGGKNIYALCNYLDSHNIRVNLFAFVGVHISGLKNAFLTIKIKDASMPINPQLIAYPVIHPSFFRRHIFKWIETSEGTNFSSLTHGYGSNTRDFDHNVQKILLDAKILDENSFYIDCEESAKVSSIEDMLLRIGLKL